MILAAAQIIPSENDLVINGEKHLGLIEQAAKQGAQLILFPEMSLTGYRREEAAKLAWTVNDKRLNPFCEAATKNKMHLVVGAPIAINNQLFIGSFIICPGGAVLIYTKQFLHTGEELLFSSSFDHNPVLEVGNKMISFAICADISYQEHAAAAAAQGTDLYLASIFYTPGGIDEAYERLGNYSRQYSMNILMANYAGISYSLPSAGRSAFWNKDGQPLKQAGSENEELIVVSCS